MLAQDKQIIRDWLNDIERLKIEKKRLEELLTKRDDKRILILLKEIELLKKENKELRESNETQYELIKKLQKENEKLKLLVNNI